MVSSLDWKEFQNRIARKYTHNVHPLEDQYMGGWGIMQIRYAGCAIKQQAVAMNKLCRHTSCKFPSIFKNSFSLIF